ncbi:MAG: protein kinase [Myxococcota bacterium]
MTQAGSEVRRYRVHDVLDKGVFGTVYRADREASGERSSVLIQVLCDDLQRDIEHLKGLRRLHRALRAAESPGLVHTEGPLELKGKLVVVSQHLEGLSLRDVLDAEPGRIVPIDIALGIVQQIAATLADVHASRDPRGRDILPVHRDVRPGNVLLTADGDVRVVGTGVALTGFDPQRMELHGGVAYLAPERLDNEESAAIDIYATTLTFLELVLGKLPKTVASRPSDHERRILEFDRALERMELPVGVRAMVREGLAFDPMRRPSAAVLERVCHALRGGIARQEVAEWVRPRVLRQLRQRPSSAGEWSGQVVEEGSRRRGTIPPGEMGPRGTAPQSAPPRATQPEMQPVEPSPGAMETRWDPESLPDLPDAKPEAAMVSFQDDPLGSSFGDDGFEEPVTMQRPPPPSARLGSDGRPLAAPGSLATPPGVGGPGPLSPMATPPGGESIDDPATVIRPSQADIETYQRAPGRGRSPLASNFGLSQALDDVDSPDPATVIRSGASVFGGPDNPSSPGLPTGFGGLGDDVDDPATMIRPELGLAETAFGGDVPGAFADPGTGIEEPEERRGNPVVSLVAGAVGLVFVLGLLGGAAYGVSNYTTLVFERDVLCEGKVSVGRAFVESTKVRPRRLAQRILDDVEVDCVDERVSLFNTDLVVQDFLRRADDGHITEFDDRKIRDRMRKASE